MITQHFLVAATIALSYFPIAEPVHARGIAGQKAPEWGVVDWINLPQGKTTLDVADYRGKVLYLYGFQSWCPGCHSHGFPTLRRLIDHYDEGEDDVAFVAVQTTFEGYSTNTAAAAWRTAEKYSLKIPVGHSGSNGNPSTLMRRYRTGGTPWAIIIDRDGVVRFNNFRIEAADAITLIDNLREVNSNAVPSVPTLPASRPPGAGQDLIGRPFAEMSFDGWVSTADGKAPQRTGKLTLYRWWTDGCPYCERSLPAIEQLRKEFEPRGLRVAAVYHPKPPRPPQAVPDGKVLDEAKRLGFNGPIALDFDWSELRKAYLDAHPRSATSVSILVDAHGIVRFVHPGPELFPSNEPHHAQQNKDFQLLRNAVTALLTSDGSSVNGTKR